MRRWQDAGHHISGRVKQESVVRDPAVVDTPKVATFARSSSNNWPSWRCRSHAWVEKGSLKLANMVSPEGKTSKRGFLGFGVSSCKLDFDIRQNVLRGIHLRHGVRSTKSEPGSKCWSAEP